MKQFYRLMTLIMACFAYFGSIAQTSCSAAFSYTVGYNKVVSFTSTDTLGTKHRWTFGDGSSATSIDGARPVHQYAAPGQYEVKHFMEKPGICKDSIVKTITVQWLDTCYTYFNYQRVRNIPSPVTYQFNGVSHSPSGTAKASWNFGDGGVSSDLSPIHTFAHAGTYQVCLETVSNGGCKSQQCQQLVIIDSSICNIKSSFTHRADSSDCKKVYFTNTSTGTVSNMHYTWQFGDGTSSHDVNISHTYAQPGTYMICLVVEGDSSCRASYCDSVIVNCVTTCAIKNKFAWRKDSTDCKKVYFTNSTSPVAANTHYTWSFGDGTTSADANPSHAYAQPGKYYVCLVSETGSNCRASFCDSVVINCDIACTISNRFEWRKDSSNCSNIYFINYSTPVSSNTHFAWQFGDGTSSPNVNPVHTYAQPGKYYVCLVSETGTNCRKTYCDSVIVSCETACSNIINKFSWYKDSSNCRKIWFANGTSGASSATHYTWNFGDGTSSHDASISHTYTQAGKYYVCLVSETGTNCRKEVCDSITVNCTVSTPPTPQDTCLVKAGFTHSSNPSNPLMAGFTANWQTGTAKYSWNFGDSTTADSKSPSHIYHKTGSYQVCLTVTDGHCTATVCNTIVVGAGCDAVSVKYEYSAKSGQPNEISFKAVSNEPILSQVWTIYKGQTGLSGTPLATIQDNNPTYLFRDSGWYSVCLTAVTSSMCPKLYCGLVRVQKPANGGREAMVISPNPAINTITLDVTLDRGEQVSIKIMDGSGVVKAVFSEYGVAGGNRFTIPVGNLNKGIYMVQIQTSTKMLISRFVKG